jgi:hypothetical protein
MLTMKLQVAFGDGIGVQHIVMAIILSFSTVIGSDTAINHEMPNMNILWMQLARESLRKTTQPKFFHGKDRRICKAFDTGGCPGKKNAAMAFYAHPFGRLLSH